MKNHAIAGWLMVLVAAAGSVVAGSPALPAEPAVAGADETVAATPALVREIQFMLLTVGIDPGPIDGNAQQLTNRAAHTFQARAGLPMSEVVNHGQLSVAFVDRLRREAALVMFKNANPPPAPPVASAPPAPSPPATPTPAPAPTPGAAPPEPVPPPDRFASCAFSPDDFRIGGKQYTTQSFLDEGFEGSTARAVTNLRKRLEEARQLAEHIGGAALLEVQRQARVLSFFECRLKIEQTPGKS
jgi:peptidoglycan hydrolase-like protein with peptidoglycan-binding domain